MGPGSGAGATKEGAERAVTGPASVLDTKQNEMCESSSPAGRGGDFRPLAPWVPINDCWYYRPTPAIIRCARVRASVRFVGMVPVGPRAAQPAA